MDKLVLVNRHNILNWTFCGVPNLTDSKGPHTDTVYDFLNIIFKILEGGKVDHLAAASDLKELTLRHKMYDDYKDTRKPMPEELYQQVQIMRNVLTVMGMPIATLPSFETNDILGTVTKKSQTRGINMSMVSGGRGLLQPADEYVRIRIPKTSRAGTEIKGYYPKDVKRGYQVTPMEFIDVKASMGDAFNNIPGAPSIGEKMATSLIVAYGSIENCYSRLDKTRPPKAQKALGEYHDVAQMSKKLATICPDCPVKLRHEDAKIGNLYTPKAYQHMERLEFKSLLTRFDTSAVEDPPESNLEEHFFLTEDEKEAEKVSAGADKCQVTGLQFITDRDTVTTEAAKQMAFSFDKNGEVKAGEKAKSGLSPVTGLTLCFEEDKIYYMTVGEKPSGDFLVRQARVLCTKRTGRAADRRADKARGTWVPNLEEMLPYLEIEDTEPVYGSGVAGYLLNPPKDTYVYDDLARNYLGPTVPSRADLLAKTDLGDALWDEDAKAVTCACYMGYVAWKAAGPLKQQLETTDMYDLFKDIEMSLVHSLYHMGKEGVGVERENLTEYGNHLKVQIDELGQEIHKDAGKKFNINSPKQPDEILFGDIQLPGGKRTKTGYSTAADMLDKLALNYPVVQKISDYHQLIKLDPTYAQGLTVYIGEDGRIHGKSDQTVTAMGRISSTEPNLRNIPICMALRRKICKVFVPKEGYVFMDVDYLQIELCILAHMSGGGRLIEAYRSIQDIHAITASEVFHVLLTEVIPLQRRNAKAVNFDIVYGINAFRLSEGLSISRKEAVEYINKYSETYSGVEVFLDNPVSQRREQGYMTTLYGRVCPISELRSVNFMQHQFDERVAISPPIQGSVTGIMKTVMIIVDRELRSRNLKSRTVLQIRNKLLVKIARNEVEIVRELLVDKMKHAASLKVSLEVEAEVGDSWLNAK